MLKKSQTPRARERSKQNLAVFHTLPHHKVSNCLKIMIWVILMVVSVVLLIYVLGSPKMIAPKSLEYHPLFTYFEWEFKLNNLNPKRFLRDLFFQRNETLKAKNQQKFTPTLKTENFINIVYGNATKSYHFDNWLFLGEYISFLANKHNKIIQKKIMTHKFAELYQRLKSQNDQIEEGQVQIEQQIAQINEPAFFRFSDEFQQILQSQDIYIQDLDQKGFMEKVKNFIDGYIIKFHDYFKLEIEKVDPEKQDQNEVWIMWLLHLHGQQLNELKKQLTSLQRRYPSDKFIILSLHPVLQTENIPINYQHINKKSFRKLFKTYLNSSSGHSNLMAKHYEYSLLALSHDVHDDESFTMFHLAGGRSGYSDLQNIPFWVLEKVQRLCKGEKIKTSKIMQEQEKVHFYRMGIYKLGNEIMWKNKFVKRNYEFQTGSLCKKIPIFHNDYISMLHTFKKTYFDSLFSF